MTYRRLFSVPFADRCPWPGKLGPRYVQTKHGGLVEIGRPALLTIDAYGQPENLMLRFLDAAGDEFTHDHPNDLEEVFSMVEREFGIAHAEWSAENAN